MLTNFYTKFPVANPLKVTLDGANTDQLASFDQRRYADSKNATMEERIYLQLFQKSDSTNLQFYTNFPNRRFEVINCDEEVLSTVVPSLLVQYIGLKYRSTAKFSSIDGKLFIYFESAQEYTDEAFTVLGELVVLAGRLPNINAKAGDVARYKLGASDFDNAIITEIAWSPTLQAEGYLTDYDISLFEPVDGLVEITYNEKEVNLYSVALNFAMLQDIIFGRFSFSVLDFDDEEAVIHSFTSEPVDVQTKHEDTILMKYRHNGDFNKVDLWSYIYAPGQYNSIRVPAIDNQIVMSGEIDVNVNDTGVPRMLRAIPFRQILFKIFNVPSWLTDKFMVIFSHDTKLIADYFWELENYGSYETVDRVDLGTIEVNMRQKGDRTVMDNTFTTEITAEFDPDVLEVPDEGDVLTSEFTSSIAAMFKFVSLPSWITADLAEFQNGDTVEFTIAENETAVVRSVTLTAFIEGFPGLTATITINQEAGVVVTDLISVTPTEINLIPSEGGFYEVEIDAVAGTRYQAVASAPLWINVTGAILIGPQSVGINIQLNPSPVKNRIGTVTFINIDNPSDTLVLTLRQLTAAGVDADSGLFGRGNSEAATCGDLVGGGHTLYWAAGAWGPGTAMYTNSSLSTALTGYSFIADVEGNIYNLNPTTGVVGSYEVTC